MQFDEHLDLVEVKHECKTFRLAKNAVMRVNRVDCKGTLEVCFWLVCVLCVCCVHLLCSLTVQ